MARPGEHGEPFGGLYKEMTAMSPTLLKMPRALCNLRARLWRGVWDGQRRDELLVGRTVIVLEGLGDDPEHEIGNRAIKNGHRVAKFDVRRRKQIPRIDVVQVYATLRVQTTF